MAQRAYSARRAFFTRSGFATSPLNSLLVIVTLVFSTVSAWGAPPTTIVSPNPELAGGLFGRSIATVGDLNNDGTVDFIVGAPGELIPAGGSISDARGRAYVISGADGVTALRTHEGLADGDQLGFSVAGGGDFDGDGIPDYAVGAPNANPGVPFAGSVYLFSGADGTLLFQKDGTISNGFLGRSIDFIALPRSEAFGADIYDDLIVSQPATTSNFNSARVFVIGNVIDATLLPVVEETEIFNNSQDRGFGFSIANVGDFDGDGNDDLGIGAPNSPDFVNTFTSNRGRAYVYSGTGMASGARTILFSTAGSSNNQRVGIQVSGAGDFDGATGTEFAVGESGFDNPASSGSNHGAVGVYNSSGATVLRLEGYAPNHQFGNSLAAAGDVNSDGFADLLAAGSAPSSVDFPGGEAFIISGAVATGATESLETSTRVIWRGSDAVTIGSGESFGTGLAGDLDLDNDGRSDWLVGAPTRGSSALTSEGQVIFANANTFFPPPDPQNVAITAPQDGALINGAGIPFTANADNADEVEFFVNGVSVGIDTSAPYGVTFDSRDFSDGNASLTIEARNSSNGKANAGPVVVEFDNKSPVLAITAPADAAIVGGAVDFTADANDPNVVTVVNFAAGTTLNVDDFDAPYATVLDTTLEPDGPLQLTVTAEDSLGNSGFVSVLVEVDNTEPTVTLTSHAENDFVSGTIVVAATAADPNLDRVEFYVEGALIGSVDADQGTFEASFDTTGSPDGALALEARAFDEAGNEASTDPVTVLVDNTAPTKVFVRPSEGRTVRNNVTVQIAADDSGSGVARVQIFAGTTEILDTTDANASVVFDTRTVIDGPLEFVCIVTDNAGNQTIDSVTVRVRNLAMLLWPRRLNLRSSGNGPVTLLILGQSASLLAPPQDHGFQLTYPGGFAIDAVGGGSAANGFLVGVEFDRLELISAIEQQFTDPPRRLQLTVRADGQDIGTVRVILRGRRR